MLLILLLGVATGLPLSMSNHDSMSKDVLLSRVLAHKDNPTFLASLFADADPAAIQEVIVLVDALLATSQGELANLTTASSEANATYVGAVAAHNAAIVAQTNGNQTLDNNYASAVAALQVVRDDGKADLQSALDSSLTTKDGAEQAKTLASELLAQGSVRLNSEIVSITEIKRILLSLLPTSAPTTSAPTTSPTTPPTNAPTNAPTSAPATSGPGDLSEWARYYPEDEPSNPISMVDGVIRIPSGSQYAFTTESVSGYFSFWVEKKRDGAGSDVSVGIRGTDAGYPWNGGGSRWNWKLQALVGTGGWSRTIGGNQWRILPNGVDNYANAVDMSYPNNEEYGWVGLVSDSIQGVKVYVCDNTGTMTREQCEAGEPQKTFTVAEATPPPTGYVWVAANGADVLVRNLLINGVSAGSGS